MENVKLIVQFDKDLEINPMEFVEVWNNSTDAQKIGVAHSNLPYTQQRGVLSEIIEVIIDIDYKTIIPTVIVTSMVDKVIDKVLSRKTKKKNIEILLNENDEFKIIRVKPKSGKKRKRR